MIIANAFAIGIVPFVGIKGKSIPVITIGIVVSVSPISSIIWKQIGVVAVAITIGIGPFGWVAGEVIVGVGITVAVPVRTAFGMKRRACFKSASVAVIAHTITVQVVPLRLVGREGIGVIADTVFVGVFALTGVKRKQVAVITATISVGILPFGGVEGEGILAVQPGIIVGVFVPLVRPNRCFVSVGKAVSVDVIVFSVRTSIAVKIGNMRAKKSLRATVVIVQSPIVVVVRVLDVSTSIAVVVVLIGTEWTRVGQIVETITV